MPAVLLMDGANDSRMTTLPFVGFFGGVVFGGTIIDNQNLYIVAVAEIAFEDGFDTGIHVIGGVVARNSERNGFHE